MPVVTLRDLRKLRAPLVKVIGGWATDMTLGLTALSAVLKLLEELTGWSLKWAFLPIFIVISTTVVVGFLTTQPKTPLRPIDGLVAGFVAGLFAAFSGGSAYYLHDHHDCASSNPVTKFVRLLLACAIIGAFLGAFVGVTRTRGPVRAPPPRPRRQSDDERAQQLANLILPAMSLIVVVAFAVELLAAPSITLGPGYVGKPQSNVAFWQFLIIVGTFDVIFVYHTVKQFGWAGPAAYHDKFAEMSRLSAFVTFCATILLGLPLDSSACRWRSSCRIGS